MKRLKIGVIGTGHLGRLHAKMLAQIPQAEFVGVYDIAVDSAKACAAEYSVIAFDSIDALLDAVDAVSIAATTASHYEVAKQCLEREKHIIVEKPITATIEEAEEIVSLAKTKNRVLQVGHIERFNPALLSVDEYIKSPLFIQSDRLATFNPRGTDVAVVLDLMIHDIDIILNLVKSPVHHVEASGVAVVSDHIDIANARISFENGAVANVTASRISQKKMRKMRLFQKDAYISIDFNSGHGEVFRLVPPESDVPLNALSFGEIGIGEKKKRIVFQQPESVEVNALNYELALFIDTVNNGTEPVVSGEDGLRALRTADAIIRKIEESVKILDRF